MFSKAHFDEDISMVWVDADVYWFIIYFCFLNIVSLSYCPWKKYISEFEWNQGKGSTENV